MTTGIIIIILSMALFSAIIGYATGEEASNPFPSILISLIVSLIIIFVYYVGTKYVIPKYHINDKIQLPDSTWGKIDSVYYEIEGEVYNQERLKD